jgi:hypothetical protein
VLERWQLNSGKYEQGTGTSLLLSESETVCCDWNAWVKPKLRTALIFSSLYVMFQQQIVPKCILSEHVSPRYHHCIIRIHHYIIMIKHDSSSFITYHHESNLYCFCIEGFHHDSSRFIMFHHVSSLIIKDSSLIHHISPWYHHISSFSPKTWIWDSLWERQPLM